jgi:hypothetical protein
MLWAHSEPAQFSGIDPTQTLSGISNAFEGTSGPLHQALGSIANGWQGESGAAANATTQAALANGAQVGTQAAALRDSLSTAASSVAQARQQMIDIIDEYRAKTAASDLSTPSGRAAAVTAANQATTEATAVMPELQGNLGTQAGQVSQIGAPVGVTNAPTAAASTPAGMLGSLIPPNGALSEVVNDPRLTPKSFTENLMDLVFLPQTMTQLSSGITQTNKIMTGLGNTLNTTNSTIGKTNKIMTGLGNTLGTTNQNLVATNRALAPLPGALSNATGAIEATNQALAPLPGALSNATGAIQDTTTALGTTDGKLDTTNNRLHTTNQELHGTNQQLQGTNQQLQGTNQQLQDINNLNPTAPGNVWPDVWSKLLHQF